ncbi:MAG: hypothetical protein BGO70_05200 [Bacteroidetes bacterium 43-93]|nr:hemerythrin domain-containing protein [Bacteroidota bacterium]OJW96799.1 MAG: hypothetical protein BGO70_05200 [Bacteroidetes bacterium 43-93]
MSQPRYNVFNQIHKGLRALMYDTAKNIQQMDFEQANASEVIDQVLLVVDLFDEHAHHEDAHILPMVVAHNAALVDSFEKDHELDHKLSEDLRSLCASWTNATSDMERMKIGQGIFYAFNEFIGFNLYHMNREEHELLLTLWQHYTDEEILAAQQAIIQSIPPETMMIESRWMMSTLNNMEIIGWLGAIKANAPEEIFMGYVKLAAETLSEQRWNTIANTLKIEQVAA